MDEVDDGCADAVVGGGEVEAGVEEGHSVLWVVGLVMGEGGVRACCGLVC